jgi:pimeloyl-ACP methyl ester carboxylesterase
VAGERFTVGRADVELAGERWAGGRPVVVLLHQGVADRRSWHQVGGLLAPELTVVAYDRRGHGETPPSTEPFSHADDLLAVLDAIGEDRVWLVGASAGGGLALDAAILAPDRIAGLVLIGTGVSGAPEPEELDPDTKRLDKPLEDAYAAADLAEINRLEMWVWLDGPAQPEGRVGGAVRALALDMNEIIVRGGQPGSAGASGVDAWHRLDEVRMPVTVACGEFDVPFLLDRNREVAARLPAGRFQLLPGTAHLPNLEQPDTVAKLVADAISG